MNDAMDADDECPFCYVERKTEQELMDFVLGSCASYMESDTREATDKAGFCRVHQKKMFDYGNALGNGWILKTYYKKLLKEMESEFAHFKPGKQSMADKPVSYTHLICLAVFCVGVIMSLFFCSKRGLLIRCIGNDRFKQRRRGAEEICHLVLKVERVGRRGFQLGGGKVPTVFQQKSCGQGVVAFV